MSPTTAATSQERNRAPRGTPQGGQFAPAVHEEPAVLLLPARGYPGQALDITGMSQGETRAVDPSGHDLDHVADLSITRLNTLPDGRILYALDIGLPEAANIKDLYEYENWDRSEARQAALAAVAEAAEVDGARPHAFLPADRITLADGDVRITLHESTSGPIDPDDLRSWVEPLAWFSDPDGRRRLEQAIADRYYGYTAA